MKNLISLLSVFAALSGFSQVYTTPEVVTNIARGEAFSILGSVTNGGGGTTNIIIVTNVLPSNLITQYYNGAYLTGTFSGVFRGSGSALSNVQPASANLTNWSMLSTSVLTTAGITKFNNSQFTTNGNTVSFRINAPVTNLFNFGTLNMSSLTAPTIMPYLLWDSDAAYALTMNFRHPDSLGDGQIVYADNTNFKWDFSNLTEPYESWINFNHAGAQFSMPPEVTAFVVTSQLGLGPGAVSDYQLASIAYVKNSTLGHKSYPSNVVNTAVPLTNGILANRGGTNFWTLDGSSLTNIQVSITNLANIVTQNMTGTMLSGTFSSGGTYPLWLTNMATEGYLMGLGSDASTNIVLRWDSSNNRLLAPAVSATGIFIGDGSGLTNVSGLGSSSNWVAQQSPALNPAWSRPAPATPYFVSPWQTPPMGWNAWNRYQCPDEALWTNTINAMVSLGLRDAGYTVVCFDAPWQEGRDAFGYPLLATNRFPSGMKYLRDYALDRGFQFGMWTPASDYTNNIGYPGCTTNWQGAGGYAAQDAHFFATNYVTYLKLDNFWSATFHTRLSEIITAMESHVATNGRPVHYMTIGYGYWTDFMATNTHSMRVATDITTNWSDIIKQMDRFEEAAAYMQPGGCYPDMDMLEIGNLSDAEETQSHFCAWVVQGSPLMLGCGITNMPTLARQLATNALMLRINQDPGNYPGRLVSKTRTSDGGDTRVYMKPIGHPGSGTNVLYLLNNSTTTTLIPVSISKLGLGTNVNVKRITPSGAVVDYGIVGDYFAPKTFGTHQCAVYWCVGDPMTNVVISRYSDVLTNNSKYVTLSGTFAGDGSGLTNLNMTNLIGSRLDFGDGATITRGAGEVLEFSTEIVGTHVGTGDGLTNLNASALASGTVPAERNTVQGSVVTGGGIVSTNDVRLYFGTNLAGTGNSVWIGPTNSTTPWLSISNGNTRIGDIALAGLGRLFVSGGVGGDSYYYTTQSNDGVSGYGNASFSALGGAWLAKKMSSTGIILRSNALPSLASIGASSVALANNTNSAVLIATDAATNAVAANLTMSGTATAANFVATAGFNGDGSGLTNLPAAQLTGTLPMGTLTSQSPVVTNGFLTTDGSARSYSRNGGYLSNLWSTASVLDFGAVPGDTNLDTVAFKAAIDSGARTVVVPPGVYVLDSVAMLDNVALVGIGRPTLKSRAFSSPFYMLDAHGKTNVTISGFLMDGNGRASMVTSNAGGGAAIWIQGNGFGNRVKDLDIFGFAYGGVIINAGDETARGTGLNVENVNVRWSYYGFYVGDGADYVRVNNSSASFCRIGARTDEGNTYFSHCEFNNNDVGLFVDGPGNNSHGSMIGGSLNHNVTALYCTNSLFGFEVTGLNIWQGNITLLSSTNVSIRANFGSVIAVNATNCGPCWITGQYSSNDAPAITVNGGENVIIDLQTANRPNAGLFGTLTASNVFVSCPSNGVASPTFVQPVGVFGNLQYFIGTNTCAIRDGVYTNLAASAAYTDILTNGFAGSASNGTLTCLYAGFYPIHIGIVVATGAANLNDEIELEAFVDETATEKIACHAILGGVASLTTLNWTGRIYLPANSVISLRVKGIGTTDALPIIHAVLDIGN